MIMQEIVNNFNLCWELETNRQGTKKMRNHSNHNISFLSFWKRIPNAMEDITGDVNSKNYYAFS